MACVCEENNIKSILLPQNTFLVATNSSGFEVLLSKNFLLFFLSSLSSLFWCLVVLGFVHFWAKCLLGRPIFLDFLDFRSAPLAF